MGAIPGEKFVKWLEAVGILAEGTPARRVVIDAQANKVIRVYVELYGSEEMISVAPPPEMRGATIEILRPKEEGG